MSDKIEVFHTKVVGVAFEGRQYVLQALERLESKQTDKVSLTLRREPENPYDKNAVAVDVTYFDPTFLKDVTRQVGYIKRDLAEDLSRRMENGEEFYILEYNSTGGYNKTRGINLTIAKKEGNMGKFTVMDLLQKKGGSGSNYKDMFLKLGEGTSLMLRFLKPLSEATMQGTHSFTMPEGWGRKYERFECPRYLHSDDSVDCPACAINNDAWAKLVLPVIDRADGKVKLFRETPAVFRKLALFEEVASNDAEKAIKIGGIVNADIQIIQIGKGKERQINAFPLPGTLRPLAKEEKELVVPNIKDFLIVKTAEEIKKIVDTAVGTTMVRPAMAVTSPFSN